MLVRRFSRGLVALALLGVIVPARAFAFWDAPVSGTLYGAGQGPLAAIDVTLYKGNAQYSDGGSLWNAVARTTTGADGSFSLKPSEDFSNFPFILLFTDPQHHYRTAFFGGPEQPDLLTAPNTLITALAPAIEKVFPGQTHLTPSLNPFDPGSGQISGRTWDALTGTPGAGYVYVYRVEGTSTPVLAYRIGTNDDGSYQAYGTGLDGKPLAGTFKLQFQNLREESFYWDFWENAPDVGRATEVVVLPGQTVTNLNFPVRRKGPLVGHVYGPDGKPVPNALMDYYKLNPSTGTWDQSSDGSRTDASGRFVLFRNGDPQAGATYRIMAFDTARRYTTTFYGGSTDVAHARDIFIPGGVWLLGYDIYMGGRPAIAGTLRDAVAGNPLADVKVTGFRAAAGGVWSWNGETYSDSSGAYYLPVDGGGTYRIEFQGAPSTPGGADGPVLYYPSAATISGGTNIAVGTGVVTGINAVLTGFGDGVTQRLSGDDRYQTALKTSAGMFPAGESPNVVLASGESFPDALSASALAGTLDAPLLLTRRTSLPPGTIAELSRLGAQHVTVVGGPLAVAESVVDFLQYNGLAVDRVSGPDRYATSAAVAAVVSESSAATSAFVVRGDTFPDALSVAPLAYATRRPVLLVRPTSVPSPIASALSSLGIKQTLVVGSAAAVSGGVLAALDAKGAHPTRVAAGADRYATGAALGRYAVGQGWLTPDIVGVARGDSFPDALGGGAALGSERGPMLLTMPRVLPGPTAAALRDWKPSITAIRVFGSPSVLSSKLIPQFGK